MDVIEITVVETIWLVTTPELKASFEIEDAADRLSTPFVRDREGSGQARIGTERWVGCFTGGSSKLTDDFDRACEKRRRSALTRSASLRAETIGVVRRLTLRGERVEI